MFEAAAAALGLAPEAVRHVVRADLLLAAEAAGGLTPAIAAETARALEDLRAGAATVLLTCSTLGPAVGLVTAGGEAPVLRVDAALAAEAAGRGRPVIVLCAVETTVQPTSEIFRDAAAGTGVTVDVRLVAGAWSLFRAGDRSGYWMAIARAAEAAAAEGAVVALAQASMTGAAELCSPDRVPLTSPRAGLAAALESARRRGDGNTCYFSA